MGASSGFDAGQRSPLAVKLQSGCGAVAPNSAADIRQQTTNPRLLQSLFFGAPRTPCSQMRKGAPLKSSIILKPAEHDARTNSNFRGKSFDHLLSNRHRLE